MEKRIVLLFREREREREREIMINYDGKVFLWCVKYALTRTKEVNL